MPEWLKLLLTGSGGGGFVAGVLKLIDRRDARHDAAQAALQEAPRRDWELSKSVLASADEMLTHVREELDTWRDEARRLQASLQEERSAFQAERAAMLLERSAWADERRALIVELNSERTQRRTLEDEIDQVKERVGVLEAKLRELGHDPDAIH